MSYLPLNLQICLNGSRSQVEHPAVPETPAELVQDVQELFAAGARSFHLHVYHAAQQSLAPVPVAETLTALRAACPEAELAVSTAEGIAPTPQERLELISQWTVWPDTLCVNLSEEGIDGVLDLAAERGVRMEAGLFTPADVRKWAALPDLNWRRALLDELGDLRPDIPRLAHGMEAATWPVLRRAAALGLGSRIGFEDTVTLPEGWKSASNLELYRAAVQVMGQT